METEIKKACASWSIQLNVDCPYCDNYMDLRENDDFESQVFHYELGKSYKENGLGKYDEFECDKCHKKFQLELIEF